MKTHVTPTPRQLGTIALLCTLLLSLMAGLAPSARADGLIIVEPPPCDAGCTAPIRVGDQLVVKSHRVDVTIRDQAATTRIDQVFFNPNDWVAEGT